MSSTTVTLLVVRHAEAEGNRDHRFIGQSDVPLSPVGRRQAEALATRLAGEAVSRIVSSDLSRTIDTVTPLAAAIGLDVEPDPRLREIANGAWTGLLPSEIERQWPDLWNRYVSGEDVPRPGGERWADVRRRALAVIEQLVADTAGEDTVVVATHGGPGLYMVAWAADLPVEGNVFRGPLGPLANASVSVLRAPERRLLSFNDVGHLLGALHTPVGVPYLSA